MDRSRTFRSKLNVKRGTKLNPIFTKNLHSEVLLDNFIEKDLQSLLKPLNIMYSVFICAKYSIRDNFITCNNFLYNFIGVFTNGLFLCISVYRICSTLSSKRIQYVIFEWNTIFNFMSYSLGLIMNYIINIRFSDKNIQLVVKIQSVLRVLKMDRKDLMCLLVYNWSGVLAINALIVGSIAYMMYIFFPYVDIIDVIYFYSTIVFDVNIIYSLFVANFSRKALCSWINDVLQSGDDSDFYWNRMFNVYLNMLDIYTTLEVVFQYSILFNTVFSVAHGLTNIAVVLQMRAVNDEQTIAIFIIMAQIWFLKDIILLACLSIACERLYVTAKELQSTLVVLIQRPGCSEVRRRVCKNIKRFQKAGFSKLSACGVFIINATLPLRLFSFITTHTIVLLQFSL